MRKPIHKIRTPDRVVKLIQNSHPLLKKKIRESLKMILLDPIAGKALKDELKGLISLRVSRFRIIYRISKGKEIEIVAIGPRDRIYEDTFRILNRRPTVK